MMASEVNKKKLLALIGPTATGKSNLALEVARKTGASILSCDSLLVYKDLDIGTAKPTREEQEGIPHFGIDLIDIDMTFTAGDYVRYAKPIVEEHLKNSKPLLIVGGTGFYLKALLCGVWDAPPTNLEIRKRLEELSNDELFLQLQKADSEYAEKIKANDRYRVVRALEIIEITGEKVSQRAQTRDKSNAVETTCSVFGIQRTKAELQRRILARTNAMFEQGLIQETKAILQRFEGKEHPRALGCVGYREVIDFIEGKLTLPEARERVLISTRQLAKKQMTFFKTFPLPIQWFELPVDQEQVLGKCVEILG